MKKYLIIIIFILSVINSNLIVSSKPNDFYSLLQFSKELIEYGKTDNAITYLSKALNINPTDAIANFYLANCYFTNSQFAKSVYHYKIAYENGFKHNYDLNLTLGELYSKLGDIYNAKKHYNLALDINPSSSYVKDRIAKLSDDENHI